MARRSTILLFILGFILSCTAIYTVPIVYYILPWHNLLIFRPNITRVISIIQVSMACLIFIWIIRTRISRYTSYMDRERCLVSMGIVALLLSNFLVLIGDFGHFSLLSILAVCAVTCGPYRMGPIGSLEVIYRLVALGWLAEFLMMGFDLNPQLALLLLSVAIDPHQYMILLQSAVYLPMIIFIAYASIYTNTKCAINIMLHMALLSAITYSISVRENLISLYVLISTHIIVLISAYMTYCSNLVSFRCKSKMQRESMIYKGTGLSNNAAFHISNNMFGD